MSAISMVCPVRFIPAIISTPRKTANAKLEKRAHDHWPPRAAAGWA
jgi:hypothetical protein